MPEEPSIRVLSEVVANKIAAGEVVERPASVLKELIENALDAGATQIEAAVAAGGRALVSVADNGRGMSRDDALLSVERHATSKIREADDLERVATLGFRGEALAAISSVARFLLRTRRAADPAGTELVMAAGKLQDVRDAGCPPGTLVEVRNLFFNVPARRKFLRSEQTEMARLRQVFVVYALAHPDVGLKLVSDGRQLFNLAPGASPAERLRDLFPAYEAAALRPVAYEAGGIGVSGHAGLPAIGRADRAEQYVFVNGRPATAPAVASAVREGYHTLLPRDRHPVVFLFIALDPSLVDVNVHPTKREVRFYSPGAVREAVAEAIRRALQGPAGAFVPRSVRPGAAAVPPPAARPAVLPGWAPIPEAWRAPYQPPQAPRAVPAPAASDAPGTDRPGPAAPASPKEPAGKAPWTWCRVVGQIGGLYTLLETEDGLAILDPHAAHERVLYERFMSEVTAAAIHSQRLLAPETVELPPRDAQRVRRHLALLQKLGFGLAEFGGDAFMADALPACFQGVSAASLLAQVAAILETAGERRVAAHLLEEQVALAACKAAVKARGAPGREELEELVRQLARTELPYTCPHGRPTLIHISFQELARKFGRE